MIRYRKRPADFDERAARAFRLFQTAQVATMTAAAQTDDELEPRQLMEWARSNAAEVQDADGLVLRHKRVAGLVVAYRAEPRPPWRESAKKSKARRQRNWRQRSRALKAAQRVRLLATEPQHVTEGTRGVF